LVACYVYTGSDLVFFDGNMRVVSKKIKKGDLEKVEIGLSEKRVKSKDFIEQIIDMKERIKRLELK
jgi:hypothetical protein